MRVTACLGIVAILVLAVPGALPAQDAGNMLTLDGQDDLVNIRASFGKLPLYFVENRGVYPDEVKYYILGADKTLFFTNDGVTFALRAKERGWAVKLDFVGANKVRPEGQDRQKAVFSYFKGPQKDWKAGLRTFSKIVYRDLWPGIDLVYKGTVNKLKYEFVVAPGADPGQIRLRYRGVDRLATTDTGALRVATQEGSFDDAPPVAWQKIDAERVPVTMRYALGKGGEFGFDIGDYDHTRPLVLDPAVLVYCGYIGGTGSDSVAGIAVDAAGNAYITGQTTSTEQAGFPVTVGPDLTHNGGTYDAYVAKVNAAGTALVYCGYIGGTGGYDSGSRIAVDAAGNAYITGRTDSTEQAGFPVTVGPDLTHNGGMDAFVAKVTAQGTGLVYCGYLGGSGDERSNGIAVDAAGNAYVTGDTKSTEQTFPVTVGPDLTYNGGTSDAYVAKVNAAGTALDYCGYIGGAGNDYTYGMAVDGAGNAYVTGNTTSSEQTFPVNVGPDLTFNGGACDAFVAKVNSQGTGLVYCGYIGGSGNDYGQRIAVDAVGNAYAQGNTDSNENTFPVAIGPDQTHNGGSDAFVAKVNAQGTALVYCGYIGGSGSDYGFGIAVDTVGNAYVVGNTGSDEKTFPVMVGPDLTYNGSSSAYGGDAFVAEVNVAGTGLVYCGYIGGTSDDGGSGIAVDAAGNAYVTGTAMSDEKTFPVTVGPDLSFNGGSYDAFVAKISLTLLGASGATRPGSTVSLTLTATDDGGFPYVVGSSLGTGPIPIDTRQIDLSPDDLLVVTVNNYWPTVFSGYRGMISTNGQAQAAINIPNLAALVGLRIHSAFVTVSPSAPSGIKSISNTFSFQITQ